MVKFKRKRAAMQLQKFIRSSISLIAALVLITAAACAPAASSTPGQTISISGAFALYPLMTLWAEQYQALHPEIRINITAGGAGKGISDTLSGAVDIGMVSRDLVDEEIQQGAYPLAVARDSVFGTINPQNPYYEKLLQTGISQAALVKIYITGEFTTWGQLLGDPAITDEIHIYTRSDSAGAAEMWAKYLNDNKQEDLLGIGVNSDPGITEAVIKDPLGIGFNNLNYLYDPGTGKPIAGIAPLPLDINANGHLDAEEDLSSRASAMQAVAAGVYPAPPARDLYLITREAPQGAAKAFIEWILTDGQKFVASAGYVQLSADRLQEMQNRIETSNLP
jgi:phosphate transport system substrate-binding protein